jgi:hypothetical protein
MSEPFTRQPKAAAFVNPPFAACPECGAVESFGVVHINRRHFFRRCVNCSFEARFPLPELRKTVIYLDQFVISNMMKELDPQGSPKSKGSHDGFYLLLFERLERLSKLQLIVCPDSILRENESLVHSQYKKFRRIFRQLSHGVSFRDPELLLNDEVIDSFRAWAGFPPIEANWRPRAFSANPHDWQERLRIESNFMVPGVEDELRAASVQNNEALAEWIADCRAHPQDEFQDIFEREALGIGKRIMNAFRSFVAQRGLVEQGRRPWDFDVMLPPEPASLVFSMIDLLRPQTGLQEALQRISDFLGSVSFRSIRAVRITASLWTCLARQFQDSRQRPIESGIYNDIDAIAVYAGLCEAMFVDKEIAAVCSEAGPRAELKGLAQIFSLREKTTFLEYLDKLEKAAPKEHLALVEEVYGQNWIKPYTGLLSHAKS